MLNAESSAKLHSDQTVFNSVTDRFGPAAGVEFGQHRADVELDRMFRDGKPAGDFAVSQAFTDQTKNFMFAGRQGFAWSERLPVFRRRGGCRRRMIAHRVR